MKKCHPTSQVDMLKSEIQALREERTNSLADIERIFAWLDNPRRKPAILSFTEGPERQVAYRFENLLHGEHICPKCGLRQEATHSPKADF